MKFQDITDIQFGGVIPKEPHANYNGKGHTYWKCYCTICGRYKVMPLDSIKRNPVSCGCIKENLVGQQYGDLLVTKMIPEEHKVEVQCQKCGSKETCGVFYVKSRSTCKNCIKMTVGKNIKNSLQPFIKNGTYLPAWSDDRKINKNNTSGFKGISYDKERDKWRAYIKVNGKCKTLGRFDTIDDAIKARKRAEEKVRKSLNNDSDGN